MGSSDNPCDFLCVICQLLNCKTCPSCSSLNCNCSSCTSCSSLPTCDRNCCCGECRIFECSCLPEACCCRCENCCCDGSGGTVLAHPAHGHHHIHHCHDPYFYRGYNYGYYYGTPHPRYSRYRRGDRCTCCCYGDVCPSIYCCCCRSSDPTNPSQWTYDFCGDLCAPTGVQDRTKCGRAGACCEAFACPCCFMGYLFKSLDQPIPGNDPTWNGPDPTELNTMKTAACCMSFLLMPAFGCGLCLPSVAIRMRTRERFNIPEKECCGDCCLATACAPLALVQASNEMVARGEFTGSLTQDPRWNPGRLQVIKQAQLQLSQQQQSPQQFNASASGASGASGGSSQVASPATQLQQQQQYCNWSSPTSPSTNTNAIAAPAPASGVVVVVPPAFGYADPPATASSTSGATKTRDLGGETTIASCNTAAAAPQQQAKPVDDKPQGAVDDDAQPQQQQQNQKLDDPSLGASSSSCAGAPAASPCSPNNSALDASVTWQKDEDVKECQHCQAPFTFTRRRHHCRACKKIYCSTCAPAPERGKERKCKGCQ